MKFYPKSAFSRAPKVKMVKIPKTLEIYLLPSDFCTYGQNSRFCDVISMAKPSQMRNSLKQPYPHFRETSPHLRSHWCAPHVHLRLRPCATKSAPANFLAQAKLRFCAPLSVPPTSLMRPIFRGKNLSAPDVYSRSINK